jgi:hypothetical protein
MLLWLTWLSNKKRDTSSHELSGFSGLTVDSQNSVSEFQLLDQFPT